MPDVRFVKLPASHESYGLVMALLMENGGYEGATFGPLARAVAAQVRDGCHLAAVSGQKLVAYVGYLPVRPATAAGWLEDRGELELADEPGVRPVLATVSVVCTEQAGLARRLLLALRRQNPGIGIVFRRDYRDGRAARKARLTPLARR